MGNGDLLEMVLAPGTHYDEVAPGLFTVCEAGSSTNTYDEPGAMAFYDRVACNPIYNWLMWGYATSNFNRLCREALDSKAGGWVLDVGCGSLAFTATIYENVTGRPIVFMDQSLTLLRKARQRLTRSGNPLETMVFLHGDALRTPFRAGFFETVIAMNLLHVIGDLSSLLREMARVAAPGCTAVFTTLVESGRWSDRYLRMWGRAGELVPRSLEEVSWALNEYFQTANYAISGNMAFFTLSLETTNAEPQDTTS